MSSISLNKTKKIVLHLILRYKSGNLKLYNFVPKLEECIHFFGKIEKKRLFQEWANLESVNADMLDLNIEFPREVHKKIIENSLKNIESILK